jgi:ketosteroid isomerase-like protein
MASLYTRDAALLPPNEEPVSGRAAIERFWHDGIAMGIRAVELETVRLEHADALAYEIGHSTLSLEPANGAAVTEVATYVLVHRRQQDSSWHRAVEIFNWNAPPGPTNERSRPR